MRERGKVGEEKEKKGERREKGEDEGQVLKGKGGKRG